MILSAHLLRLRVLTQVPALRVLGWSLPRADVS
jgi:hypothetical protein